MTSTADENEVGISLSCKSPKNLHLIFSFADLSSTFLRASILPSAMEAASLPTSVSRENPASTFVFLVSPKHLFFLQTLIVL